MADGVGTIVTELNGPVFSQSVAYQASGTTIIDFATAQYYALTDFLTESGKISTAFANGETEFTTSDGNVFDTTSLGGITALGIYMDTLQQKLDTQQGAAKLGLDNEKQMWKLQ